MRTLLNINTHPLRNLCAGFLLACFPALHAQAQSANGNYPAEEIDTFFSQYLKTQKGTFAREQKLEWEDVEGQRDAVWQSWVKANQNFEEDKLIPLNALDKINQSSWTLPSKLEPHAVLKYYYGTKGTQKPKEGYPLFLYLHGSGEKNGEWETGFNICQGFKDSPSVYFIPQIPNTGEYYRWWQKAKQFAWEKLLRLSYVNGEINPNRVYFFGISEGGYGSQRLASFYADYLAGAGPMAGGEPLINAPVENCCNLAFSLRTGAEDEGFFRNTITGYASEAFDAMEKQYPGYFVHNIQIIPHYGHGIDYRPTTPWLVQHKRNPYPKKVMWENYPMDGIKRKGFYNLYIERDPMPARDIRVNYNMDIADNQINLDISRVTYTTIESRQGIDIKFERKYMPIGRGLIRIYLNDKLVDFSKPITVTANGKTRFVGMVTPNLEDMVNSCARFFDPERVYPASILVDMSKIWTGIESVEMDETEVESYYDLNGRKVAQPEKGIYITNTGKKVKF